MRIATVLDTRDVDEARTTLARSYCPHRLHLPGNGQAFRARHVSVADAPLGVFRLGYGAEPIVLRPVPFREFLLVSRPLAGSLEVRGEGRRLRVGAGESVALDHTSAHEMRFAPGCRLLTIKIPLAAVNRTLAADDEAGSRGRRPATGLPRNPTAWNSAVRFLVDEAVPNGLLGPDSIMRRHTVQLVVAAMLSSFASTPTDERRAARPTSASFRRAVEFIEDRARDDIGLLDIAAAAGLSPRALQYAFRRNLDTTPLAYLRDVRLGIARRELRADTGRTIADIAYSCGFGNLGRFASDYRAQFGSLPSDDHPRAGSRGANPPARRAGALSGQVRSTDTTCT